MSFNFIHVDPNVNDMRKFNVYEIIMQTYFGDADGDEEYRIMVDPSNIHQTVMEIIFVAKQFPNGRGGCRTCYDQRVYFLHDEFQEKYFSWLNDYPYIVNYEQNNTLDSYKILYHDKEGQMHKVKVDETHISLAVEEIGKKHRLGNYDIWDTDNFKYDYSNPESPYFKYFLDVKSFIDNAIGCLQAEGVML